MSKLINIQSIGFGKPEIETRLNFSPKEFPARRPELVSRNGHSFTTFGDLPKQIAANLPANTVLDCEIDGVDRRASQD